MKEKLKYYFKFELEDKKLGVGEYYCEVVDNMIQRQVQVYKDIMFWATKFENKSDEYSFTDQPFLSQEDQKDLIGSYEVTYEQFQDIWSRAHLD